MENGINHTGNHVTDNLAIAEQWVNDRVLVGTITTDNGNLMRVRNHPRLGAQLG